MSYKSNSFKIPLLFLLAALDLSQGSMKLLLQPVIELPDLVLCPHDLLLTEVNVILFRDGIQLVMSVLGLVIRLGLLLMVHCVF